MTKVVLIDLNGGRTEREETGTLVPSPPLVLHHDGRPFVRRRMLGDDRLVYQEATCSWLAPYANDKRHPREEDCEIAEAENANLRAIVAWVSATLRHRVTAPASSDEVMGREEIADEIAHRLDGRMTIEDGGVTIDSREEEREAVRDLVAAAGRLADRAEEIAESNAMVWESCRSVRSRITEVEEVLGPSLHEARQTEEKRRK